MTRFLLIGFLFIAQFSSFGQTRIITGRISDIIGRPINGALICQAGIENCTYSDESGVFHIVINELYEKRINVSFIGYQPQFISNLDTVAGIISIVLHEYNIGPSIPEYEFRYGFFASLQVDLVFNDFGDFKPLLKDYNVDLMNESNGIVGVELAGFYNRYYMGLNFGYANDEVNDHDSLDIVFNSSQYGLHFGYNLLDSRRILLTPKVAIKWNRYRLLNNNNDKTIPLEQYINERDIDLRFNQMTGFVGINLAYKAYINNLLQTDFWSFGVYGGYVFKLHDKPWIYSRGSRLTSNGKIGMENYNFGVHFSFHINGW